MLTFRHMLFVAPQGDSVWDDDNAPMKDGEKITPIEIHPSGLVKFERWSNGHTVMLSPGMFTLDPNGSSSEPENMTEGSPFGLLSMAVSTVIDEEDDDVSIVIDYPQNNAYFVMGADDAINMGHVLLRRGAWAKAVEAAMKAYPGGRTEAMKTDVIEMMRAAWNLEEGVEEDGLE